MWWSRMWGWSHEFNNNLTNLAGNSELPPKEYPESNNASAALKSNTMSSAVHEFALWQERPNVRRCDGFLFIATAALLQSCQMWLNFQKTPTCPHETNKSSSEIIQEMIYSIEPVWSCFCFSVSNPFSSYIASPRLLDCHASANDGRAQKVSSHLKGIGKTMF
jgi:hypothetical protein